VVKRFGSTTALAGVDLEVAEGLVFGLLGPNGAGKTTLVRILATLLEPDAGRAELFGRDVIAESSRVRELLALTGQFAAVDELLTGRENLEMFGRLFRLSRAEARRRAWELLERFELVEAADRTARTYSGGMRRRLDLASSLLTRPRVLFLDEPTTGLDPRSRNEIWEIVRDLRREGTTILLTTQYLEERGCVRAPEPARTRQHLLVGTAAAICGLPFSLAACRSAAGRRRRASVGAARCR
jgi:ABC-2 type transport system ATP-binding protein